MQVLLASFAVMSLVFAGCNAKTEEKMDVNDDSATIKTEENTDAMLDAGSVEVVNVDAEATSTTTAQ